MFIKLWHLCVMDVFERCVGATGDPLFCMSVDQAGALVGCLAKCIEVLDAESCRQICLGGCRGEGGKEVCLGVLEVALGVALARDVARRAAAAAAVLGIDLTSAVALAFSEEVEKVDEEDCPERETAAKALAAAAVELYRSFKKAGLREQAQDVLLLMAPALAAAHRCVGDWAFEYLDFIKPFVGEEAVRRIVAAMEEGAALVGGVAVEFEPAKAEQ